MKATAPLHPIFRRYMIGHEVTIHALRDGKMHEVTGVVECFSPDGQMIGIRKPGAAKPSGYRAADIVAAEEQMRTDRWEAARAAAPRATERQIEYVLSLIAGGKTFHSALTADALRSKSRHQVSLIIDEIKEELGYDD